jgi:hypothetical protein
MKQVYFICGNIAAGKTTLLENVHTNYPEMFEILQIDFFRNQYSNGTFKGENHAWRMLYEKIVLSTKGKVIVESSGTSKNIEEIQTLLLAKRYPFVTILIDCEPAECLLRLNQRGLNAVPMPYKYTTAESVEWIGNEIHKISFDAKIKQNTVIGTFSTFCRMLKIK